MFLSCLLSFLCNPYNYTLSNLWNFLFTCINIIIDVKNTDGHAQRGLQLLFCHSVRLSICLSVCLLPRFLPLRATRRPISDTDGFSATLALF